MKCPFCQNEMNDVQTACPACKRPHAHAVAYQLGLAWNSMQQGDQLAARTAFDEAIKVTPANDRKQLQSYIAFLIERAGAASPAASAPAASAPAASAPAASAPTASAPTASAPTASAPTASVATASAATASAATATAGVVAATTVPQASQPKPTPPSSDTVSAPTPRLSPQPQAGKATRALFLNFNEKPVNIVRVMDETRHKQVAFAQERTQRLWIIALLLPLGLPFVFIDLVMGYNFCTFSLVALVLWVAALVGFVTLRSNQPTGKEFGPQYDIARTVFETLRDDVAPKRTLIGWLDLSGARQSSKVVRQRHSASGMPVAFYRDEWLRMKMPLYDGNVVRVAVVERVKARLGMWKTGRISHKRKWKAGGTMWARREIKMALTINPEAYEQLPIQTQQIGKFTLDTSQTGSGRIVLEAATNQGIGAADILRVMRFAYEHLKPRGEATS